MNGRQCLLNSRRALCRGFLSQAEPREGGRQLASSIRVQDKPRPSLPVVIPARCFSISRVLCRRAAEGLEERQAAIEAEEKVDRRYTLRDFMDKTGRDRLPRDHEITDPQIRVLDSGSIEGPLSTRFVLTKLNPEESLRMVEPYTPANEKEGTPVKYALCKVVNKEEEYKLEKERKERKKKQAKPKTKEVELSWGISEHDLLTKTRQVGGFLEKGLKVELVLGKKRGGRQVSAKDSQEVLKKVRQEIQAREGFETKPPQGDVGGVMRLWVERKGGKKK